MLTLEGREFKSASQWARAFTESWWEQRGYCLACDSNRALYRYKGSEKAWDFRCLDCNHPYQLKANLRPSGSVILDGKYDVMLDFIAKMKTPTFVLMRYTREPAVPQVAAVHRTLITADAIRPRPPLRARKKPYIMCNVSLAAVPDESKIAVIEDGSFLERDKVREQFQKLSSLEQGKDASPGWLALILTLAQKLPAGAFRVDDLLRFEEEIATRYPNNRHVREKIRQQLQLLRDAGLVQFLGGRQYRLIPNPTPTALLSRQRDG